MDIGIETDPADLEHFLEVLRRFGDSARSFLTVRRPTWAVGGEWCVRVRRDRAERIRRAE